MDPSSQTRSSFRRTTVPERSGLLCRVKYCNSLPDIPFDPKCITYTFNQQRFVQYKATSLENQHKHALLAEPDLGVTIDLINPDTYRLDPSITLDPADEMLLEEDIQALFSSKRSLQHAKVVPWMRKTEYISTEVNRYGVSNGKAKCNIGESDKQHLTEEIYKDRDRQISAVEKTFEDAQRSILRHHSKAGVTSLEVLPVFPDFKMWANPCAQVIFDSDPAPRNMSAPAGVKRMSQAIIQGMPDEEEDQFVGYFLPSEETLRKRKRDANRESDHTPPDELYDYNIAQEYNWEVKNKASKDYEENYLFIFRDGDGVYFNELETRLHLGKRRRHNKAGGAKLTTNTVLLCKHRDMSAKELRAQEARRAQLENIVPEDKEEDVGKVLPESGDEEDKSSDGGRRREVEYNTDGESEWEDEEQEPSGGEEEEEEEEEEEGETRQRTATSGSESGENRRTTCDVEEIFGSDDDIEEYNDGDEPKNYARSSEEEEEEEGGMGKARTKELTKRVQGQMR